MTMTMTMKVVSLLALVLFAGCGVAVVVHGLIPATPQEQTRRAIASIRNTIDGIKLHNNDNNNQKPLRIYVDYLIPLPPKTKAEDIDPWPGGLAQMYPYAETIITELLQGVCDDPKPGGCSSQVLSAPDCCGFFIQESVSNPKQDIAAVVFPSVDQLQTLAEVDAMVGPERTLLLVNKQFQRPVDFGNGVFGRGNRERSQTELFDRYTYGFALQELACRGEDVKLLFESSTGWQSSMILENEGDEPGTNKEMTIFPDQPERPIYEEMERKINALLPEPLWMRKMQEANEKGLKFTR